MDYDVFQYKKCKHSICLRNSFCFSVLCYSSNDYYVRIANNGPVVLGANITFTAEVLDEYGRKPSGPLRFVWLDDALPPQGATVRYVILFIVMIKHSDNEPTCIYTFSWVFCYVMFQYFLQGSRQY